MDFKIAGTQNGITGIQLDLKIDGISEEIIRATLAQSREARMEILRSMLSAISRPRPNTADSAPRLVRTKIDPEKIGLLIGPGGKNIRGIQEDCGVTIDVEEDGTVTIAGEDQASVQKALDRVEAMTASVQVGRIYEGTVTSVKDFGAFVEILPGKDGLCHISELANEYVNSVGDVCRVGDEMRVKVIAVDEQDRVKLSRKAAMLELAAAEKATAPRVVAVAELGSLTRRRQLRYDRTYGRRQRACRPCDDESSATVQRLLDQYTEIARLAGGLAHEIKNPLSTIRLNMELLAEDLDEPKTPAQRRALKRIEVVRRECDRLQALLGRLPELRQGAAAAPRAVRSESPDRGRARVLRPGRRGSRRPGRPLSRSRAAQRDARPRGLSPGAVELDPQRQAGDARRRAAHGAHVPQGDNVAIHLIDTGRGMDDRTASKMFEAFFSTKPGGSGLGLPTTQKIIDGHHGRISVESEVGRGTQFTIELPVPARLAGGD